MIIEKFSTEKKKNFFLLLSIFVIANCGIIYELIAGAVSSYLLGNSIMQFSIVIGLFMSSMGLGSFLSRFISRKRLVATFAAIEIILGIVGGFSALILMTAFSVVDNYEPFLFIISVLIGAFIGLEIPLVIRILKNISSLKIAVSNIMTADYIGALFASLLFPLLLLPQLGMIKTALFFGLLNVTVGGMIIFIFSDMLPKKSLLFLTSLIGFTALCAAFIFESKLTGILEKDLYKDEIIYSKTTPYQRIVITSHNGIISLFLNGSIQFCSKDEHRYHESLVHPAMTAINKKDHILLLGGGDGMAVRELLKYSEIKTITLVDLDPAVTTLFKTKKSLRTLNNDSLNNKKVSIISQDAFKYIENLKSEKYYNLIIIDLPDPHGIELSKLYSKKFYTMLMSKISADGAIITQATSPVFAREAFWCINNTIAEVNSPYLENSKVTTLPYHAYIPSLGEWGFILASPQKIKKDKITINKTLPLKFLKKKVLKK